MAYEMIANMHVPTDDGAETVGEIARLFARWNEALGNPWPDLAFKTSGKDGGALVYRAHLIGQTEWSSKTARSAVAALIGAVPVSGKRWPQVGWTFQSPLWGGHEFSAVAGQLEGTKTDSPAWQLLVESCLEDPWTDERDPAARGVPACFGLFHATSVECADCPAAAR